MIKDLDHLPYQESLSNMDLFNLGESKLRWDLRNVYLKGHGRQMDEAKLFLVVCSNWARCNSLKLEHRKFCTEMKKNFFVVRLTEHWDRLPRGAMESSSIEIFKTHLDAYLGDLL